MTEPIPEFAFIVAYLCFGLCSTYHSIHKWVVGEWISTNNGRMNPKPITAILQWIVLFAITSLFPLYWIVFLVYKYQKWVYSHPANKMVQ